jgi:curved DNA-binding protein CbpA
MDKVENIDPYKVLNVPRTYNLEQLKEAYKSMALKVHPDKGGSEYLFNLVTACYKALFRKYKARESDKQYMELKSDFEKHVTSSSQARRNVSLEQGGMDSRFDISKFNHVFQENKSADVTDNGYLDFLRATPEAVDTQNPLKGKKLSNEAFNEHFERATQKQPPSKMIIKYKEPEPLPAKKSVAFTELGIDKIEDFSGDNTSRGDLHYMDLKIAHTTSRIVDPRTVGARPQYKNINDIENDRSKVSYTMSDKEVRYYELKRKKEEEREKQRQAILQNKDNEAAIQFERLHKLMLGR